MAAFPPVKPQRHDARHSRSGSTGHIFLSALFQVDIVVMHHAYMNTPVTTSVQLRWKINTWRKSGMPWRLSERCDRPYWREVPQKKGRDGDLHGKMSGTAMPRVACPKLLVLSAFVGIRREGVDILFVLGEKGRRRQA